MKSSSFWLGILGGMFIAALFGVFALPAIGVFNVTATGDRNILDWWGKTNVHSVISRSAPETALPATADPQEGFTHYRATCLTCHGAPDAPRREWANHMLPKPPELWKEEVQHYSDGELFYIVNNGIRMTGMPAFGLGSPADTWNIVAFLRQLDSLTQEQKQQLQQAAASGSGHGSRGQDSGHGHQQ